MGAGKPDTFFWISFNADCKSLGWTKYSSFYLVSRFAISDVPCSVSDYVTSKMNVLFHLSSNESAKATQAIVWNQKEALGLAYIVRIHEWIVIIHLSKCHSGAIIG